MKKKRREEEKERSRKRRKMNPKFTSKTGHYIQG